MTTKTANNHDRSNSNNEGMVDLQILLSRPYYRIGGKPVVSTILVRQLSHQQRQFPSQGNNRSCMLLRDRIASLQFTMMGLCRYDPRWFNANKVQAEWKDRSASSNSFGIPPDYELPPHTIPFWSSNVAMNEPMELLNIQERTFGKWVDVNPMKPIRVPRIVRERREAVASNGCNNQAANADKNMNVDSNSNDTNINPNEMNETNTIDESHQLAYTIRINLPQHFHNSSIEDNTVHPLKQPHSFHGASCRYYYLIVVRLQMKVASTDHESDKVVWKQQLVTILPEVLSDDTPRHSTHNSFINTELSPSALPPKMQIMAHSNGLPTRLTSIELNQWEGRYTVNRLGSTLYQNISRGQSMRIVDPISQRLVGMLTILGTPNDLHHGSRLTLKMDFPIRPPNPIVKSTPSLDTTKIMPCFQVSACLEGQEVAITVSKTATSKRTIARRYVWDTAHETIDPDTTENVALDLLVPESIPCSIQSPNVELNVQCIVDIAVGTPVKGRIDYRNIHLEIPCLVRPIVHDWEQSNNEEEDASLSKQFQGTVRHLFDSAVQIRQQQSTTFRTADGIMSNTIDFETSDIQTDLKLLSFQMAKICDLVPKKR